MNAEARLRIRRSGPLAGTVTIPGAKNSVLKLMASTLLADGEFTLTNVPAITDVGTMSELLEAVGVRSQMVAPGVLQMVTGSHITPVAPAELVERIRASVNLLGPLLGRFGRVTLAMPGGDDFGSRPIDMHIKALEAMGAEFTIRRDVIEARADRLHGAPIALEFPSVGATENILTAAVHAKGITVIDNAAREPEISDLCDFLVGMGANVSGIGTSTLTIEGIEPGSLQPTTHATVPDRIQAATYLAAVGVCQGHITLLGARADHMEMLLQRFQRMGLSVTELPDRAGLEVRSSARLKSTDVATLPYPGVATDYKPLIVAMLSVADGVGIVTENLYPGRFRYVEELQRLGADIRADGHHAVVRGVPSLTGCEVTAPDIRAGAAMVVAGLAADGDTFVSGVRHIDRGYDDLVGRLSSLGADVVRLDS